MAFRSYHLWLKSSDHAYRFFASLIRDLAVEMTGPVFEPHITLLGNIGGREDELVRRTKELAAGLAPFEVSFGAPDYRETHFQCLFLHAVETAPLLEAHKRAGYIFEHAAASAYMPHLSLLYGSYPVETKLKVIERLPADLPNAVVITVVSLIRADSDDPKDWQEVCAPQLGSSVNESRVRS